MTRPARVHQFTAVLAGRDAVGQHTPGVDQVLRSLGCEVENFAANVNPDSMLTAHHFTDHDQFPEPDLILYQLSTGSPVGEFVLDHTARLVLNYHNITPAEAFDPWEPAVGAELDMARRQLARLVRRASAAIADSHYNAAELTALGLDDVAVAPIIVRPSSRLAGDSAARDSDTVLFVGRIAPNKRHEDLIKAVALLRSTRPSVHLDLIGAPSSHRYQTALKALVERLDIGDAVTFHGSVPDDALDRHYSTASVYASASDHEGFCVPLIEAMAAGLPIVARDAAAVPETLGDAGLLVPGPDPVAMALALDRVLGDPTLRKSMVAAGKHRATSYSVDHARQAMTDALRPLIEVG